MSARARRAAGNRRLVTAAPYFGTTRVQGADVNEKSLRGTLPRMEREGRIIRPRRGYYALPTSAEGPAVDAAGLSVSIPAVEDQEGGGASGTDAHRVRDDPSSWQAEHLDHDLGAPVEGA